MQNLMNYFFVWLYKECGSGRILDYSNIRIFDILVLPE
jgi:hypothetical protein